jgi:hypothetical protein
MLTSSIQGRFLRIYRRQRVDTTATEEQDTDATNKRQRVPITAEKMRETYLSLLPWGHSGLTSGDDRTATGGIMEGEGV